MRITIMKQSSMEMTTPSVDGLSKKYSRKSPLTGPLLQAQCGLSTAPTAQAMPQVLRCSDALLKSCNTECLDHGRGRLCLHHHHLAENLPLASLGGRLLAGLQHAQAGYGELTILLHLVGGQLCKAVECLPAHSWLQLCGLSKRCRDARLAHGHNALHRSCLSTGSHVVEKYR